MPKGRPLQMDVETQVQCVLEGPFDVAQGPEALEGRKYPKAAECLAKDRDVLLTFYEFPAEHWVHLPLGRLGVVSVSNDSGP